MGQYVYTVACAAVFVGIILAISPDSEEGPMGKYIAFIGTLALAVTMLAPLPSLLSKKVEMTESAFEKSTDMIESTAEYYANSAAFTLYELYKTEPRSVSAKVKASDSGEIEEIILTVNDSTYYSPKEAGKVLSDIYGIDITVRNGG